MLTGVPLLRTGPVKRPSPGYRVMRNLNRLGLVSEARMEAERQKRGSADYKAASGVMRDILIKAVNETYESQMAGLGGTVKLLWGRQDAEVPVSVAERAMTMMPTASLEVLEGVGHHVPMQAPSDLRRVVDTVLS